MRGEDLLGQSIPVSVGSIESELKRQRDAIQGDSPVPLQLVRMATLVIFTDSLDLAVLIDSRLPDASSAHPARVLLLVGEPGTTGGDMLASIKVRPLQRSGTLVTISEQVTLVAQGPVAQRLPSVVRALVLSDLPINLWWASNTPPPMGGPLEAELSESVQQVVYDSLGWPDPARGFLATSTWLELMDTTLPGGRWRTASDVSWRRLKYWRRLIAQALNPASAPGSAETLTEILVEHGPHAVGQAWMLACWLCMQLGWEIQGGRIQPGTQLAWRCRRPEGVGGTGWVRVVRLDQGPPEIRRVRLACEVNGMPGALTLAPDTPQRLALTVEGTETQPRTLATPPMTLAEIIGRQLNDRDRDPVFRETMARCRIMAQSLLDH
jgi:glucose-6-phosphate dehydrogenase assembly protein OpcA